ncbi:MAG: hypothetical protein K6E31_07575 [bacterium]|nr:hypothetical protein [bacterium]
MYRTDETYKALEALIKSAGVKIRYTSIPDDSIKGPLWARSEPQGQIIEMPEDQTTFECTEQACLILGHEMGHILADKDSSDEITESVKNEAICDLVGYYLYRLAEMIAGTAAEERLLQASKEQEK